MSLEVPDICRFLHRIIAISYWRVHTFGQASLTESPKSISVLDSQLTVGNCVRMSMFVGLRKVNKRIVMHYDEWSNEVKSNFVFNIFREVEAGKRSWYLCIVTYFTGKPVG